MYSNLVNPSSFEWNTVVSQSNTTIPPPRWGHSSCIVNNDLYIFGGFANSQYMNDLWVYSPNTLEWRELVTLGDVPQKRSNATLNYDPVNKQLLLFGGGGPNKHRFNTVSSLDLSTLNWMEIEPFETEAAPWERTYHIAQFKYPYLIVFGGESADDLGDLWVYDVRNLTWQEVKVMDQKPCARRFHASCLVGQKIYILGGCYGKYKCLGQLFCLDISKLIETEKISSLKWEKIELKGKFQQRWGHTLDHYNGNLIAFGGRSSQDMNDLISISLQSKTVKKIQTFNDPNARRRHSGGFIGSSLVLFGGFDGNYYDDLFYINLFQSTPAKTIDKFEEQMLVGTADQFIFDIDGESYFIHASLLGKYFRNQRKMLQFLKAIDKQYFKKQLDIIFSTFYKGWGSLPLKPIHFQYIRIVPNQEYQTSVMLVHTFMEQPQLSLQESTELSYVELEDNKYRQYMNLHEEHWQMDRCLILNQQYKFTCCSRLISLFSEYFNYIFNDKYKKEHEIHITINQCEPQIFKIVLAYLHSNILVIPKQNDYKLFKQIALLSDYFSLPKLTLICQEELSRRVTKNNSQELLSFSYHYGMQKLEEICCLNNLNQFISTSQSKQNLLLNPSKYEILDKKSKELYSLMLFDLAHKKEDRKKGKNKENKLTEIQENENVPNILGSKDSSKRKNIFR